MEDDLNLFEKGRRPNFFWKSKTTSKKIMQPQTIKTKNNGCGTAPGNLVLRYYLTQLGWKGREIRRGLFSTLLFKEESLSINLILVNVRVFLATICKETICAMAKIPTTCKQRQFLISFITSQAAILIISYCDTPTKLSINWSPHAYFSYLDQI